MAVDFRMLERMQSRLFSHGAYGSPIGLSLLRKDFTKARDVEGEELNYKIVKRSIAGFILPQEGALRSLAEGTRNVQDYLFFTDPIFDSTNTQIIQVNDIMADANSVVINSDGTYTVNGPVYRVQYVKNWYDKLWEVRLKVGQDQRS
jgi:hypothetical protein